MKGLRKSLAQQGMRGQLPRQIRCEDKKGGRSGGGGGDTTPSSLSYSRPPSLIHSLTHPSIAEQDKALATRAGSRAANE